MGWSTTAPTLPSGVEWAQAADTVSGRYNNFSVTATVSYARMSGKQLAIMVVCTVGYGQSGKYYTFGNWFLQATVAGTADAGDNSLGSALGTQTFYYIAEAGASAEVKIGVGWNGVANWVISFTAPKLRGATAYVNVNGSWKEATMFVNVGGTWKEAQAKINVGGDWK